MPVHNRSETDIHRRATPEDVRHVLGELDDTMVAEIVSVGATFRDLTDAAIWARGDGDLIAREHRELSAGALVIADIVTRADEAMIEERD
jgi:hypothetical protein